MDYQKLQRQPVTLVLAEFRFSTVLSMKKFVPEIQEHLRKDFPEYQEKSEHRIELDGQTGRQEGPIVLWEFASDSGNERIRLATDRLIFITNNYDRFPGFSKNCEAVLRVLHKVVQPKILKRIGLRYNDTVVPIDGSRIEEYLISQFFPAPPLAEMSESLMLHRNETHLKTESGRLIIQTLIGRHGMAALPELLESVSKSAFDEVPLDRATAVVDFDHIWEAEDNSVPFTIETALTNLDSLHDKSREAFWRVTTDKAREEYWV